MTRQFKARVGIAAALIAAGLALVALATDDLLDLLPRFVDGAEVVVRSRLKRAGVVAYWDFDDARPRERIWRSGCGNGGTRLVFGRNGSARSFLPEQHGAIRTEVPLSVLGKSFSFACWLRLPKGAADQQIFQYLAIRSGALLLQLPGQKELTVPGPLPRARFFHVAFTADADAGKARVYLDGALAAELDLQPLKHAAETVLFGQQRGTSPPSFWIDESSLWNRPLSGKEVGRLSRLRWSLAADRAGAGLVLLSLAEGARDTFRALLLTADLFNPFLHENRILGAGLPSRSLVMSRNDVKYFTRWFNEQQLNGLNRADSSKKRKVEVLEGDRTATATIELFAGGDAVPESSAKRTFTLETLSDEGEPERKVLVRPIEGTPYLLEILAGALARGSGIAATAPELCVVSVNSTFEGLHLCTEVPRRPGAYWLGSPGVRQELLRRLPVFKKDVLAEFDRLAATLGPALRSDRKSPLTSREVLHEIRAQRRLLEQALPDGTSRDAEALVTRVAARTGEEICLGDNPHASLVLGDLDLSARTVNGTELTFESLTPAALGHDGRVTPAPERPTPVTVRMTVTGGGATRSKILSYVILPERRRLPIMRIASAGDPPARETADCISELIGTDGRRERLPEGRIRLRGNSSLARARNLKKYYRLELDRPHEISGLGRKRLIYLTSGWKDATLVRDRLGYDLYREFSAPGRPRYSPRVRPVELVLNGDYRGIYNMMERIDGDLLELGKDTARADGPLLYKAMGRLASFHTPNRVAYIQKLPDWRDGEKWGPYEELVSFIGTSTPAAFREGIERRVDVDNIIDFEIILTLTSHFEGQNFNLFIARAAGADARFFLVPWDFDMAMYNKETIPSNHLIGRLHRDLPGYGRRVWERWQALRGGILAEKRLMERLGALEQEIAEGVERNYRRWPLNPGITLEGEAAKLHTFFPARLPRLDGYFKSLSAP